MTDKHSIIIKLLDEYGIETIESNKPIWNTSLYLKELKFKTGQIEIGYIDFDKIVFYSVFYLNQNDKIEDVGATFDFDQYDEILEHIKILIERRNIYIEQIKKNEIEEI